MKKRILEESKYTFNTTSGTVAFADSIEYNKILLITNITDNQIIYNFGCSGFGGSLSARVLTLEYEVSGMSNTDTLQVIIADDTDPSDDITHNLLDILRKQTEVQDEMLEQLQICAKYLRKIYNPE